MSGRSAGRGGGRAHCAAWPQPNEGMHGPSHRPAQGTLSARHGVMAAAGPTVRGGRAQRPSSPGIGTTHAAWNGSWGLCDKAALRALCVGCCCRREVGDVHVPCTLMQCAQQLHSFLALTRHSLPHTLPHTYATRMLTVHTRAHAASASSSLRRSKWPSGRCPRFCVQRMWVWPTWGAGRSWSRHAVHGCKGACCCGRSRSLPVLPSPRSLCRGADRSSTARCVSAADR